MHLQLHFVASKKDPEPLAFNLKTCILVPQPEDSFCGTYFQLHVGSSQSSGLKRVRDQSTVSSIARETILAWIAVVSAAAACSLDTE